MDQVGLSRDDEFHTAPAAVAILQYSAGLLTADEFAIAAKAAPWAALEYASDLLAARPDLFADVALSAPRAALVYAPNRLDGDLFAAVVAADPESALELAGDRLDDAQFAAAVREAPMEALASQADRLTPEQFAAAVAADPESALEYVADRLTAAQKVWCRAAVAGGVEEAGPAPAPVRIIRPAVAGSRSGDRSAGFGG